MKKLILQQNATSEWHSLISDTCKSCKISLGEDMESYLVFLLMRFTKDASVAKKIIALDFLRSQHQFGKQKQQNLQDIGDICLLFSGLFPEIASRRRIRINYYIDIGRRAYGNLSEEYKLALADLYSNLSDSFVSLMSVLQGIRKHDATEKLMAIKHNSNNFLNTGALESDSSLNYYIKNKHLILNGYNSNYTSH